MIDAERLLAWDFPDIEHSYSEADAMLYALSIGIGADPLDERQLRYVNDSPDRQPRTFPTMAVVLGYPGPWMADRATGIDYSRIVHGEETIWLHRLLAPAGTVVARHRVVDIVDKGAGRGAVITYDKLLFDKSDGALLATVRHTTFARGDGGFSRGPLARGSVARPVAAMPDRPADRVREIATLPQQALLYRLLADRNPLHSDPVTARAAGFERPILHGLCTYGMAGHAIVADWCDDDPARLRSLHVRFSAPVLPGDTLVIEMFEEEGAILFQARTRERGALVLSNGRAELLDASA